MEPDRELNKDRNTGNWVARPTERAAEQSHRQRRHIRPTCLKQRWSLLSSALLIGLAACQQAALPTITRFEAAPAAVNVGDPVTLAWRGTGAASCTLTTGQQSLTPENCDEGSVTERYAQAGTFAAELTYTAPDGSSLTETAAVVVGTDENSFTTEQDGLSVTFSAPAAVPDNTPENTPEATFTWDFGDGETGSGARVTHLYALPGDYVVTLSTEQAGQDTRSSRTILVSAPNRTALFSGGTLAAWERVQGGAANWRLRDDYAEVRPGKSVGDNNLKTTATFGDFRLHLEFWVPQTSPGTPEQERGNSGVYLQGRYEVQILDSYERDLEGQNDAGAIYEVKDADQNASLPPETWQSYDVEFRAARFTAGQKTEDARVSVFWNGQLVQVETVVPGPTRLGAPEEASEVNAAGILQGPIVLQDHGDRVRFRNIWLEPL